jgi:hypothetical protein
VVLKGQRLADDLTALDGLTSFGPILALKLYRISRPEVPSVPTVPCLDHEAMLHGGVAPHAAVYIQEASSGDLHEVVVFPAERRIQIDTVSTWGEHSPESRARLQAFLRARFADCRVTTHWPSWWRGELRVAAACLAQVSLHDVLLGEDIATTLTQINRLQTISTLMEKESRVASWGVRTVTGPLLPAAGVVIVLLVSSVATTLNASAVTGLRYALVSLLGAAFLYYGLKAVQLTEMANRVWKRTAEYSLIIAERQRLAKHP